MSLQLLLTWFPILLGVGLGGRLLGRTRGFALGFLCALFWIALVQASEGASLWRDGMAVAALFAGSFAVMAMGGWAGESAPSTPSSTSIESRIGPTTDTPPSVAPDSTLAWERLSGALDRFDDWLEDHRLENNPWPRFDEFLRGILYECCKATHVKPFRLIGDGEELSPLAEIDPTIDSQRWSARAGRVGRVLATGSAYLAGDAPSDGSASTAAEDSPEQPAWCFAISQGTTRLGVVVVGQLEQSSAREKAVLGVVERMVSWFWCMLVEIHRSRAAVLDDPASGLYNRGAFLSAAEQSLAESYQEGEPSAVAVIAVEGLRELNDSGRWETADALVREVGASLRRKVRMDDRLGRFDGSRFIMLLRRVDAELASLIVTQMMTRLRALCEDRIKWRAAVGVRCGLSGTGPDKPDLRAMVSRALTLCQQARVEKVVVNSDLVSAPAAARTA